MTELKFAPWHFAGQGVLVEDDDGGEEIVLGNLYDEPVAHLIEAAPELYAAVKLALQRFDDQIHCRKPRMGGLKYAAELRAALALADRP